MAVRIDARPVGSRAQIWNRREHRTRRFRAQILDQTIERESQTFPPGRVIREG